MKRCRTMLFMPGNNPGMLSSAQSLGADIVIFDLEDAVAQAEKDAARILVRNALTYARPQGVQTTVRINDLETPHWKKDVACAVEGGADIILAPKVNSREYALEAVNMLEEEEKKRGLAPRIVICALVETTLGIENAFAVASAHKRVRGMLLGAEDLTAELGARRTPEGAEIQYARSRVLTACRAAGIKAIDSPFPFVSDMEGLAADAAYAAQLGFDGKAVISPQHVVKVNEAFMPTEKQINWANRVVEAARRAEAEGKGAVSLDGMMVDLPIIKRAERILSMACTGTEDSHAQ